MNAQSLTVADALKALREDIRAEDTLIASRVTWYVTSQSFLLTAYAASWQANFIWPTFFHVVLPLAAIALSAIIFSSIYAATWAQDVYLREQASLVARLVSDQTLSAADSMVLDVYRCTMVGNRTDGAGRVVGGRVHALVRITPLILPAGFSLLWLYAWLFAPLPLLSG